MRFFKYVMIVLLKRHASGRRFDKIYLKAIKTFFFSISDLWPGGRWTQFFGGSDFQQKGKVQTFWLQGRLPPTPHPKKKKEKFFFLVGHPDLPLWKTLRRVFDLINVMILKRVSESIFFQINKFTASSKIKKRWQILWYGIQSTEDYPSISR